MTTPALEARNRFRATHPARRARLGEHWWEYWAGGHSTRGLLVLGPALAFGDSNHRLVQAFEGSRRVLSPTLPPAKRAWEVIDGLVRLLDLENLPTVDVFGYGLGAGIAHLFVRRHRHRVGRVALSGFGLLTPFHAAASRALGRMFEQMPYGSIRQHYLRIFQRQAEVAGDPARAAELLAIGRDLLDRNTHASALAHYQLQNDLFRFDDDYLLTRPSLVPAMLMLANDDPSFTRLEQDNLARSYSVATVVRHLNAGRIPGLSVAPDLEKKLEVFFRPEVMPPVGPSVLRPNVAKTQLA